MFIWPVVAVATILLAVWYLGARDSPGFPSDDAVRSLLRDEHPEFTPTEVARAVDRQAALARGTEDLSVAVAFTVGNRATTRILSRGDVRAIHASPRVGVVDASIATRDMGCPVLAISMAEQEWVRWRARLDQLVVVSAFIALLVPQSGGAQQGRACGGALEITTEPAVPKQGTFFRIRLAGVTPGTQLGGRVGDEPLHFVPALGDATGAVALAGAGIDAPSSLGIVVTCRVDDVADSVVHAIQVTAGAYPLERLKVSPEFSTPPDSALAARIARESERARQVALLSHATPRQWEGAFVPPRASRLTSTYGRGRQFNGTVTSRHMGADFAGVTGAPVVAVNRGVVRIVDRFFYGGNVVYVDHGNGVTTAYLHLSRQVVSLGDTVTAGQKLGEVGATGRVTGPHLHLIARYGTTSLDPMSLLRLEGPPK